MEIVFNTRNQCIESNAKSYQNFARSAKRGLVKSFNVNTRSGSILTTSTLARASLLVVKSALQEALQDQFGFKSRYPYECRRVVR
jgi:hypothetical protein